MAEDEDFIDKMYNFASGYKGLVAGLILTAASIGTYRSIIPQSDPLVERVQKIDKYYTDTFGYIPGRYGTNMNVVIRKNINDIVDSLNVRNQLTLTPGYESRERAYAHLDTINSLKMLGVMFMGASGLFILIGYGAYKKFNIEEKKQGDKNAALWI
jgi:hypothetical protein